MTTPDHILPPPVRDNGPLETMAMATIDCLEAFDVNLVPTAIVDALTEAGYAIVPVEPTEAMLELGLFEAESCTNDWTASAACLPGHVWKAMLHASAPIGTKEGE